ncbi:tetratricopeptide repeat protein [Candidatus Uabimicrobium amorphum]|uniref:Tetratricopeptide repeat domain protein n=1 Tax=Uabimicrobium amorphum TaxID=2596890 RepID=A0A5S9INA4_UABAM|nr:tetratricopeptide repeat protein [Candidatus Uabimicrobium amorphum]BBM84864.1 tetratricopeptide repeat domain protein [Candidatus Uabimicrobium amorphum]
MDISTQILQKIRNKTTLFFCGAGISLEPPAGLPDWKKLRDFTLESITKKNELLSLHLPSLIETPMIADPGEKGITPEVVASEIMANCSGYFESFRALKDGKPNINHIYLAKMARAGFIRYIITTNFDTFIEDALHKENVPFFVCRTDEEFAKFDEQQQTVVLKLHGCLSLPKTITSTVEQEAVGLSFEKKQAIRTLLGHYHFLFWGYSGADLKIDLDYLEHVSCKDRAKGFYWHFIEKGDFVEKVNTNVEKLVDIYGHRGNTIHGLFPDIFRELFPEEEMVSIDCSYEEQQEWQQQKNQKCKKELDEWSNEHLTESQACTIVGNLLYHNGKLQEAFDCYARGIDVCQEQQDQSGLAVSLSNCGSIYRIWGEYEEALSHYQRAEKIARSRQDYEKLCIYLNNIGKVYRVQGNYAQAASYYKDAAKLSKQIGNQQSEGVALNNLGMAHFYMEDYEKAQLCYERSLLISKKVGDKQTTCAQLNNIGNIYGRMQNSQKSLEYYSQALEIALALGDKNSLIVCWNNLGVTSRLLEKYSQAKEYFLKSLQASQLIGDLINAATTSKNLAILNEMEGKYSQAIDFYEMSVGYFRSLQDTEQINKIQNRISKLHLKEDELEIQMPSSILQAEEPPLSNDEILSLLQIGEEDLQQLVAEGKIFAGATKSDVENLREELMLEQTVVIPVMNVNASKTNVDPNQQQKAQDKAMNELQIEKNELNTLIQQGKLSQAPTIREIENVKDERMMQATIVMNSPISPINKGEEKITFSRALMELQMEEEELEKFIESGEISAVKQGEEILIPKQEIDNLRTSAMVEPTIIMPTTQELVDENLAIIPEFHPDQQQKAQDKAMNELQIDQKELDKLIRSGKLSQTPTLQEISGLKDERMMEQTVIMNAPNLKKERQTLKNLFETISTPALEEMDESIHPIFVVNSEENSEDPEKLRQRAMNELQIDEEQLEQMIVRGEISATPSIKEIQNLKNDRMAQKTMQMASFHLKEDPPSDLQILSSPERPRMASQMQSMSLEFPPKRERPRMETQRGSAEIILPFEDDPLE